VRTAAAAKPRRPHHRRHVESLHTVPLRPDDRDLEVVRGVIVGLVLAVPLWVLAIAAVVLLLR
jgi:hypothetical protein